MSADKSINPDYTICPNCGGQLSKDTEVDSYKCENEDCGCMFNMRHGNLYEI